MKINEITIEQLNAVEEAYRKNNVNPFLARETDNILADKINESGLAVAVGVIERRGISTVDVLAFGIHLGVLLAQAAMFSPVVPDQTAS